MRYYSSGDGTLFFPSEYCPSYADLDQISSFLDSAVVSASQSYCMLHPLTYLGSYIARFLAEMLDCVGLLSAGNEEMARFAWKAFAQWQQRRDGTPEREAKKKKMFEFMKGAASLYRLHHIQI